jgi:hypothetical protein
MSAVTSPSRQNPITFELANDSLFDLSNPFSGEVEVYPDLLQSESSSLIHKVEHAGIWMVKMVPTIRPRTRPRFVTPTW